MRHASLRNVIERAYGVIKKRFPALKLMNSYPFHIQVDIVMSCFMLHNFIRRNKEYDDEFDVLDDDDFELYDDDFEHDVADYVDGDGNAAASLAWRDDIAS